jgi:hypothetical protein
VQIVGNGRDGRARCVELVDVKPIFVPLLGIVVELIVIL